jgi:hypothetical protein
MVADKLTKMDAVRRVLWRLWAGDGFPTAELQVPLSKLALAKTLDQWRCWEPSFSTA